MKLLTSPLSRGVSLLTDLVLFMCGFAPIIVVLQVGFKVLFVLLPYIFY